MPLSLKNSLSQQSISLEEINALPWRALQKKSITKIDQLYGLHGLKSSSIAQNGNFPLLVPLRLALKMNLEDPYDPLYLQFVTSGSLPPQITPEIDPLQELPAQLTSRLLKKYASRTLFLPTSACAMHCRYCFRQDYPYATSSPKKDQVRSFYEKELESIAQNPSINEVILSGGDPLSLSNSILGEIVQALEGISHIQRIRWHTRFPIAIPQRIDEGLTRIIQNSPLTHIMVLHINHPSEIDSYFSACIKKLRLCAVPVLAQAVLLHRVNDDIDTLHQLSEALSDAGILFYYLHQVDPIEQACPFWVDPQKGKKLIAELRERVSGYGVPTYVQEIATKKSKTTL